MRHLKLEGKIFGRTAWLNCPGERKQQFTKEQTLWVILSISKMDDSLQRLTWATFAGVQDTKAA